MLGFTFRDANDRDGRVGVCNGGPGLADSEGGEGAVGEEDDGDRVGGRKV